MTWGIGSLYAALFSRGKSQQEVKNEPASATLKEFIEIPDYGKDAGYVHRVDEDLRRILKIIQERYNRPRRARVASRLPIQFNYVLKKRRLRQRR